MPVVHIPILATMSEFDSTHRVLVVIPALNESESIAGVIRAIRAASQALDVLVVDDGSTDDTARVARAAGATVVSLPYNLGVGGALRTGFRYATRHGYDAVIQADADGQHPAEGIPALMAELDKGADLVIGSRFLAGDRHYEVERTRGLAMEILRRSVRILLGQSVADCTSGFRGFSRPMYEHFSRSYPREFLSDTVEALLIAGYGGYVISEVPVRMQHRVAGLPSHRSLRLAYHYVRLLVVMGLTASLQGRRTRQRVVS